VPRNNNIVAALDTGTSKISCLIGEIHENNVLEVIGKGAAPSHGIKKGAITDIDECAKTIELAVMEAENQSGVRINSLLAGVSGEFIVSGTSRGKIKISGKNQEVTDGDIAKVMSSARMAKICQDRRILHAEPMGYHIDGHNGIRNPVGMVGNKLEVDAYLIAGDNTYLQNIARTFQKSGLEMDLNDYVYSSLATANTVLDDSDKNLGVALIDMGAGTTKINVFKGGVLVHSRVLPLGGDNLTYDIAMTFKIPLCEAESLKISKGCACPELLSAEEEEEEVEAISFSESETLNIQRKMLSEIIEARLMDIFEGVRKELNRLGTGGIFVAGSMLTGGTARLKHINYLSQRVLEMPAKIGKPCNITGLGSWAGNPEYSSVTGILQMAADRRISSVARGQFGFAKRFCGRVFQWLQDVF